MKTVVVHLTAFCASLNNNKSYPTCNYCNCTIMDAIFQSSSLSRSPVVLVSLNPPPLVLPEDAPHSG